MTKAASEAPAKEESKSTGSSAPRARKWNYGITDSAKLKILKTEEQIGTLKGDLTGEYVAASKSKTVAEFMGNGGTRHGLRVLMRREILALQGEDGTTYPIPYVKPEPKAKAEKPTGEAEKAPAKKAAATPKG